MNVLRYPSVLSLVLLAACASSADPVVMKPRAIDMEDLAVLEKSLLFTTEDVRYLRMSRELLEPKVEELLDVWYGFVGANDHLLASFVDQKSGKPDTRYLGLVRERFKAWVLDTADANFDRDWLAKQNEIGRRHHRVGKNRSDGVDAAPHIPLRHLIALQYPVTATIRPFLERGDHSPEDVNGMHEAWRKAVLLTVILWSQPYVIPGDF